MLKTCLLLILWASISHTFFSQTELIHEKICDLPTVVAESSGILVADAATIWTHNDSGYENELYLVDSSGQLLRTVVVENALNVDWEDLAYDTEGNIWINDAGNNSNSRRDLRLYKIYREDIESSDIVTAKIIDLVYPDQVDFPPSNDNMNFDIEAMIYLQDSLYLFTKNRSMPTTGYTKMYSVPAIPGQYTANLVDSFFVDSDIIRSRVTAADIYFPTGKVSLLTRTQIIEFSNYGHGSLFGGTIERKFFASRTDQVEGLGFLSEDSYYMTDEGSPENNVPGSWYRVISSVSPANEAGPSIDIGFRWDPTTKALVITGREGERYQLSIFDSSGMEWINTGFIESFTAELKSVPRGLFVVRVESNSGVVHSGKFIQAH